jgi:hypothetical protein
MNLQNIAPDEEIFDILLKLSVTDHFLQRHGEAVSEFMLYQ